MPTRTDHIEFIARGLIHDQGAVLLCRSVGGGYSYLPGGHIEFGEPAFLALLRELSEEAGLAPPSASPPPRAPVRVSEHVFTDVKGRRHHEINLVFHVEHAERLPESVPSREPQILFEWTPLSTLDGAGLLPERMRDWLEALPPDAPGERGADWLSD